MPVKVFWAKDQKILDAINEVRAEYENQLASIERAFCAKLQAFDAVLTMRGNEYRFLARKIEMLEQQLGGGIIEDKAADLSARIDALESRVNEFIRSQECKWDGIDG